MEERASATIELDEPSGWPAALRELLESFDEEPSTSACSEVRRLVGDRPVRLYHATRLTDLEIADVRAHGLRRSSPALVRRKVDFAVEAGVIDRRTARLMGRRNLAAEAQRRGLVWFAPHRSLVTDPDPDRLWIFFRHWGGQGVWLAQEPELRSAMQSLGRPALVVATIPADRLAIVTPPEELHRAPWGCTPRASRIGRVLWEAAHGLAPTPFLITTAADVPPSMIEDVRCAPAGSLEETADPFAWSSASGATTTRIARLAVRSRRAVAALGAWPRVLGSPQVRVTCCDR